MNGCEAPAAGCGSSARARLRVRVKRLLRRYGYPPDHQERAAQLVLEQAEVVEGLGGVRRCETVCPAAGSGAGGGPPEGLTGPAD